MTYDELNKLYINAMKNKQPELVELTKAIKNTVMQSKNSPNFAPTYDMVEKAIKKEIKINKEIIETTSNMDVIVRCENNIGIMESWLPKQLTVPEITTLVANWLTDIPPNDTKKPDNIYKFLYVKNIVDKHPEYSNSIDMGSLKSIIDSM